MQIKNYKLTADELIELVKQDPKKAREVLADISHEYNSVPCGLTWKVAEPVRETIFQDNKGNTRELMKTIGTLKSREDLDIRSQDLQPMNSLVIGENYHLLLSMQDKYKGQIGLIYCDVPYNTGKKDEFIFNGKSVDISDTWRDAKWLSFMNKRLRLMKNLLQLYGIIVVSVDDHEQAHMKLLMDEIFGRSNHLATCPIEVNPSGRARKGIALQHEYLLIYTRNIERSIDTVAVDLNSATRGYALRGDSDVYTFKANRPGIVLKTKDVLTRFFNADQPRKMTAEMKAAYEKSSELVENYLFIDNKGPFKRRGIIKTGSGSDRGKENNPLFYPVYYDPSPDIDKEGVDYNPKLYVDTTGLDEATKSRLKVIYPYDPNFNDKRWSWSKETLMQRVKEGNNVMVTKLSSKVKTKNGKTREYAISYREYAKLADSEDGFEKEVPGTDYIVESKTSIKMFKSMISGSNVQTIAGSKRLKELIGNNNYDYQKPVGLIYQILNAFTVGTELIADFFAGSCTTFEAMLKVNREQGKELRCILCTSNEANSAYDVSYKRIKALKEKDNYDFNLNVFDLDYIDIKDEAMNLTNLSSDDNMITDQMQKNTTDYYKFVYNTNRVITDNLPNRTECLVNDYDGVVVTIQEDSSGTGTPAQGQLSGFAGFGDFVKGAQSNEADIDTFLKSLDEDLYKVFVRISDISDRCGRSTEADVHLEEQYPFNLLTNIRYGATSTADKVELMKSKLYTMSEEESETLQNTSVDITLDSDEEDLYEDEDESEEDI